MGGTLQRTRATLLCGRHMRAQNVHNLTFTPHRAETLTSTQLRLIPGGAWSSPTWVSLLQNCCFPCFEGAVAEASNFPGHHAHLLERGKLGSDTRKLIALHQLPQSAAREQAAAPDDSSTHVRPGFTALSALQAQFDAVRKQLRAHRSSASRIRGMFPERPNVLGRACKESA